MFPRRAPLTKMAAEGARNAPSKMAGRLQRPPSTVQRREAPKSGGPRQRPGPP